jgi:uncharacterized protein
MSAFTITNDMIWRGTIGGAVIGAAAGVLLLFNGDVMGCSGIVTSSFLSMLRVPQRLLSNLLSTSSPAPSTSNEKVSSAVEPWKIVFLSSMAVAAYALGRTQETPTSQSRTTTAVGYALAGLLVGFGTKLGSGCTSGHGICGLARFSPRSLAAVLSFMASGVFTTTVFGSYDNWISTTSSSLDIPSDSLAVSVVGMLLLLALATTTGTSNDANKGSSAKLGPSAVSGAVFAAGLYYSGMSQSPKVRAFLDISPLVSTSTRQWDPTLVFVMGGGVLISFLSYQFVPDYRCISPFPWSLDTPVMCTSAGSPPRGFNIPKPAAIDRMLIAGSIIFGIGWGIAGVCPGPAVVQAAQGVPGMVLYWWPSYFVGAYLAEKYKTGISR